MLTPIALDALLLLPPLSSSVVGEFVALRRSKAAPRFFGPAPGDGSPCDPL